MKYAIAIILLFAGSVFSDDYLTVWVSSQMNVTERNTVKAYGKMSAKNAPLVTQVMQGPNTHYWQISISTNTNVQNMFITNLKNSGKIVQVSAFTLRDDGSVIQHFWDYPKEFFEVWQASGTVTTGQ